MRRWNGWGDDKNHYPLRAAGLQYIQGLIGQGIQQVAVGPQRGGGAGQRLGHPAAQHVLEQVAAHGGWSVHSTSRPTWRPTDGFEAKGLRAGRTITDLTLVALRPVG